MESGPKKQWSFDEWGDSSGAEARVNVSFIQNTWTLRLPWWSTGGDYMLPMQGVWVSIPGWGTKIPDTMEHSQKKKDKKPTTHWLELSEDFFHLHLRIYFIFLGFLGFNSHGKPCLGSAKNVLALERRRENERTEWIRRARKGLGYPSDLFTSPWDRRGGWDLVSS